jgi:hypothetical protein
VTNLVLAVYESVVPFFFFFFFLTKGLGCVRWSKAYLQALLQPTHTTCLTKYKPKRNEEKQNKEKQKQVLPWSDIYIYIYITFIIFSGQIQVCKMRRFSKNQGNDNKTE